MRPRCKLPEHTLGRDLVTIDQDDESAALGQPTSCGATDPAASTRDDDRSASYFHNLAPQIPVPASDVLRDPLLVQLMEMPDLALLVGRQSGTRPASGWRTPLNSF